MESLGQASGGRICWRTSIQAGALLSATLARPSRTTGQRRAQSGEWLLGGDHGLTGSVRARIRQQYQRSLAKGLWKGSYAGSNEHEFFAELSMWYWGTHGDLGMQGTKPANGRDGLKAYDPEACTLLDEIYNGKLVD